jgi:hypothetical protein
MDGTVISGERLTEAIAKRNRIKPKTAHPDRRKKTVKRGSNTNLIGLSLPSNDNESD